jgi:hypothetical protein
MRFLLVQTLQDELDPHPFYAGTSGLHPICKVNLIHIRHNLPGSFWFRPYNVRPAISTRAFWSTVDILCTLYNVSLIHIHRTLRGFLLVQSSPYMVSLIHTRRTLCWSFWFRHYIICNVSLIHIRQILRGFLLF